LSRSKNGDDLSELPVRLQIAMRLNDLIKRKRAVDNRLQLAFVEAFADVSDRHSQLFRIAAGKPDIVPLIVGILAIMSSTGSGVTVSASAP
jgi:hypothetical protein